MNIVKATRRFEEWLGRRITVVKPDIRLKHQRMAESPFSFLRATFYRWMQVWPEACPELDKAPRLLGVGDLHVENFGTWRDREGRLVWGINDFDEAAVLPYTVDLVRTAASALLAIDEGHLTLKPKDACDAIEDGYRQSLLERGHPFVLEEENKWLREIATTELRDPVHFWQKMDGLPKVKGEVPAGARKAIKELMPERNLSFRMVRRVAGLGSLGHVRVVALAGYRGGRVAREAKALAPSAVDWVRGKKGSAKIMYEAIIRRAVRCLDPFVELRGHWIIRRLSPHCCRIELIDLPAHRDEIRLFFAMGWETANIHLGSRNTRKDVRRHIDGLKANWLHNAAKAMSKAVISDWQEWKKSQAV